MAIASPCIRNCCLNDDDVCLGCNRTIDEILRWGDASDEEKIQVLLKADNRKAERKKKFSL